MFTKFFKILLLVGVILMFVFVERSHSQEEGKVIIVSPKVGEVIDLVPLENIYKIRVGRTNHKNILMTAGLILDGLILHVLIDHTKKHCCTNINY